MSCTPPLLLLPLLLLLLTAWLLAIGQSQSPPNIVVIFLDDVYPTADWSFAAPAGTTLRNKNIGYASIATPAIASIMAESVLFTRSYTAGPVCAPARFVLLTGRLPMRSEYAIAVTLAADPSGGAHPAGFDGTDVTMTNMKLALNDSVYNIPQTLQSHGYYTGIVGKHHLLTVPKTACNTLATTPNASLYSECTAAARAAGFDVVDAFYFSNIADNAFFSHNPEWMVGAAQRFIDTAVNDRDQPFFLYLATTLAHDPSTTVALLDFTEEDTPRGSLSGTADSPRNRTAMRTRAQIYAAADPIHNSPARFAYVWVDDMVGALRAFLIARGLYDDTLVAIINDHGPCKYGLYEHGMRVVQFIRYPPLFAVAHAPYVIPADFVVSTADLAPVLFEIAGIADDTPAEYVMDGQSWLSDVLAYIETEANGGEYDYGAPAFCCQHRRADIYNAHAIVSKDYKYIYQATALMGDLPSRWYAHAADEQQLYHFGSDPNEQKNLVVNNHNTSNASEALLHEAALCTFQLQMIEYIQTQVCAIDSCRVPVITAGNGCALTGANATAHPTTVPSMPPSSSSSSLTAYPSVYPSQPPTSMPTSMPTSTSMTCESVRAYAWQLSGVTAYTGTVAAAATNAHAAVVAFHAIAGNRNCSTIGELAYFIVHSASQQIIDVHLLLCCGGASAVFGDDFVLPSEFTDHVTTSTTTAADLAQAVAGDGAPVDGGKPSAAAATTSTLFSTLWPTLIMIASLVALFAS